jgi:amidase
VAVGTETDGSIVGPASCCSVVGLKPTVGLVSRSGIVPISATQDTAGPMGRCVTDVAVLLGVLAGEDPADPATAASAGHVHTDYTRFLDAKGLQGARIGVARQYLGAHREVTELIEQRLTILKDLGAELVDPVNFRHRSNLGDPEYQVFLYEFKAGVEAYLAGRGETVAIRSLNDLINFNEENFEQELRLFGQEHLIRAAKKGPLSEPAYLEARERCATLARTEGIDAVMTEHRLDAIVAPTLSAPPWLIDHVNGDSYGGGCSTIPAVAGYPHLTIPAGYVRGLPIGLSFFGRAWSEPALLSYAFAFEQAAHARRTPHFLDDASFDAV